MQEFAIASTTTRAMWVVALIPIVVMLLASVLLWATVTGARSARFEISPDGLRLRGDLWGRSIPLNQLDIAAATRIDLASSPELTPTRRTMGTGLPGYQSGWFRLRNGEQALLYLTDRTRAVYVPTRAGYSLLLSPAEPDRFVAALRAASGR